jgi:hypothetical protein
MTFLPPSNAMTMQMSSTIWRLTDADWEPQKALIRQLCLGDDRPLRDVMAIMEREHGFKATLDSNCHHSWISDLTLRQCEDV